MRIAIHTEPGDMHAVAATHILRSAGHEVFRCIGTNFPSSETLTFRCGSERPGVTAWSSRDGSGVADAEAIDSVWYRRPRAAHVPGYVHESDVEYTYNECTELYRAFVFGSTRAFWINTIGSQLTCSNKVLQLRHAIDCGVAVPETLVSNDPAEVRDFVARQERTIYKPLRGAAWEIDGKVHGTYTTPITAAELPSDRMLAACPGIYQSLVKKRYEVRAQFFGSTCIAVKIDSLGMQYGEFDWRRFQAVSSPGAVPWRLPRDVYLACRQIMQRLDIVSGAFDFIVDTEDRWVFLEVNPVGQFAFLELWCPELRLFQAFCEFIVSRDGQFEFNEDLPPIYLAHVLESHGFAEMMRDDSEIYGKAPTGRKAVKERSTWPNVVQQ